MLRGALDLPSPGLAVSGVVNHQVITRIFPAGPLNGPRIIARPRPELDVEGIRRGFVVDGRRVHGRNFRSQKALCTVSPSGSKMTRSHRCSASMRAQTLIRPSLWVRRWAE